MSKKYFGKIFSLDLNEFFSLLCFSISFLIPITMGTKPIRPIRNDGITKETREKIILIVTNKPIPTYCPITA